MTLAELHPNRVYLLRNLLRDVQAERKGVLPVRLALLSRVLEDGGLVVRLRMGGFGEKVGRWAPARRAAMINVVREATQREIAVGMPL